MAQTTTEAIQQLYLAYFNRPAEPGGLAYWVDAITKKGGKLADVSAAFSKTPEYQAQFANMAPDQIIAKIYDNLFNRAPDPSGLKFWSGNLASGALTISNIVDQVASSAVSNPAVSPTDTAAVTSKVAAAVKFTDLLNSDPTIAAAYGTPGAGELAKAYLHGVKDAATLASADASLKTGILAKLLNIPLGGVYDKGVLTFALPPLTAPDGSQIPHFKSITFAKDGTIVNVLDTQKLLAHGALDATAKGYAVADDGAVTWAGELDVTADRDAQTVTLKADAATVNVTATLANATAVPSISGNAHVTIEGDLRTLVVNTANAVDAKTPTADTLARTTIAVTDSNLAHLTSVTLTGNGSANVDNGNASASMLAVIDASGLGGKLTVGTHKGELTGGLTFTGNSTVQESILLGSGHDVLTVRSTYGAMDTITGFDAVKETATADLTSTSDVLYFAGQSIDGAAANANIVKLKLAATDTSVALTFVHAATVAAPGQIVQFSFGGNTYLFADTGATAGTLDADDAAIKLVGSYDLTTAFGTHA